MKNGLRAGIILLALTLAAGLVGAEGTQVTQVKEAAAPTVPAMELPALEEGRIVQIPVDQDSLKTSIPPWEEGYLYDEETGEATGYQDPSITVNIGKGRIYETNYIYARIKIASASQLRTLMASPIGNQNTTPGHDLAKRVRAVIAINGDFPGGDIGTQRSKGVVMRQAVLMRKKCDGRSDVLMIDKNGDLRILLTPKTEDIDAVMDEAVDFFTFGPALVVDGVPRYDFLQIDNAPYKGAQRMAICQTGPLEYLVITSEGPEDEGSVGLTIEQFIDLVSSIPDVKTAYNLDGGSSATMVFRKDGKNWVKVNAPTNRKIRPLKDIIYFASAWDLEGTAEDASVIQTENKTGE